MSFPYQVNYGPSSNNPTLIPNFGTPIVKNGVLTLENGGGIESDLGGNTKASGSITIAGTVASGNTITVTVANGVLPGGSVAVSYTLSGTDTLATAAAELALLLNSNATLSQYGWSFGTNGLGEVLCYQRGPVGNFSTLSATTTGAETFTIVQMSGGAGVVVPLANFTFSFNNSMSNYWYGKPVPMSYLMLKNAVAQGAPLA